ncbi:3-deoxy-manno-octulosonate cytidylyltransferase [Gallibacterium anatis]|uniref:3-deoxy-manno-octulosonate cytidylyltransferase n=1 Tax=Gallibacterium anatis TaxID=750 RepID=UPI00053170D8|nr:3-deoxy-manno-octulosonate cytidylyltransferase [Gallibacterium anatis]KGQ35059.1 3-deoxy-manno-octulosonate cytidylyltransferase [Gallibacterium anatis]
MRFSVIIPSRYASSRLPGKPLKDIAGKPMIQHVWEKAQLAGATRVIVATDHPEIEQVVKAFGGEVCLTSDKHNSGTERLAEVVTKLALPDDEIVVNIQGDEPLIPPVIVKQVAENLDKYQVNMATLSVKIDEAQELFNPNVVKVLTDKNGYVLYFSRAVIPWHRDQFAGVYQQPQEIKHFELLTNLYQRHIGIYAYRAGFIRQYVSWQPTALERCESLEQLRVLWNSEKIHCEPALEIPAVGVDTEEDLLKVRAILSC